MKPNLFSHEPVIFKLSSGMEIHLLKDDSFATYVELSIHFGSFMDHYVKADTSYLVTPGSAHFIEHKMFAMPEGDAFSTFSALGISANAMTSYTTTSYTLNGTENMLEGVKKLLEMIDTPYFTDENIETEKPIIIDELNMYEDDADTKIYNEIFKQLYWYHPVREDIGGTIDSVASITKEELLRLYEDFYQPSNRKLIITGPIDIDAYKNMLSLYDKTHEVVSASLVSTNEPLDVLMENQVISLDVQMEKFAVGFKFDESFSMENRYVKNELIATFALNMMIGNTTDFYEKYLREGLLNHHFTYQIIAEDRLFCLAIIASTKSNTTLSEVLLKQLTTFDLFDITELAFRRFKKTYLGNYIMGLSDFEYKAYLYGRTLLEGISIDEMIHLIDDLTIDEVRTFISALKEAKRSTLYVEIK